MPFQADFGLNSVRVGRVTCCGEAIAHRAVGQPLDDLLAHRHVFAARRARRPQIDGIAAGRRRLHGGGAAAE